MFTRHLHTQKTVLGKKDHDGYECKYERSFANLTVLSVRFIFLSKVQSFLSFDGRCALCFGKTRHIASTGESGSVVCPTCSLSHFIKTEKNCLLEFLNKVKSNTLIFAN